MKDIIIRMIHSVIVILAICPSANAELINQKKKVIEYGWDVPATRQLIADQKTIEKTPFNGVVFRLEEGNGNIFSLDELDAGRMKTEIETLSGIKWNRFTDNFIITYAKSNMNWLNDEDWEKVQHHLRFVMKAAKAADCKGIIFDPEPYGRSPWHYSAQNQTIPAEKYREAIRARGNAFIKVISEEMADAKVIFLFGYSFLHGVNQIDATARAKMMNNTYIGALYTDFLNGVLEGAPKSMELIDGNEVAYGFRTPTHFFSSYTWLKQTPKDFIPQSLHGKYDTQFKVSHGLYIDPIFHLNLKPGEAALTPEKSKTPAESLREMENIVFNALRASDEYVWVYSERMNWWTEEGMPEGLKEAIQSGMERNAESAASNPQEPF